MKEAREADEAEAAASADVKPMDDAPAEPPEAEVAPKTPPVDRSSTAIITTEMPPPPTPGTATTTVLPPPPPPGAADAGNVLGLAEMAERIDRIDQERMPAVLALAGQPGASSGSVGVGFAGAGSAPGLGLCLRSVRGQ